MGGAGGKRKRVGGMVQREKSRSHGELSSSSTTSAEAASFFFFFFFFFFFYLKSGTLFFGILFIVNLHFLM